MKKLNKLQINSGKIMKNEELIALRGGYNGCSCLCYDWDNTLKGSIGGSTALTCNVDCLTHILDHEYGNWSC